jgi:hypothetical protein
MNIFKRLLTGRRVQQIIGKSVAVLNSFWYNLEALSGKKTIDETRPDYSWWDSFRHGVHKGYEIAGVLAQTSYELITEWVMGRGLIVQLEEIDDARMQKKWDYTNGKLRRFFDKHLLLLSDICEDYMALGDQFVVVNPDLTLSIAPPNTVEVVRQDLDYRKIKKIVVRTNTDDYQIEEHYYADHRTVRTRKIGAGDNEWHSETFPNLIGRIPVVQFAYKIKSNELYGHPLVQSLRYSLSQLNDLTNKGIQGAKVAGNPIPVFENLDDPQEIVDLNADTTDAQYMDADGNVKDRTVIKWDRSPAIALGTGGRFRFGSPPVGFSEDILNMIESLFELLQHRSHTPDFLWPGNDTETKAGVEAKIPPWVRFIENQRARFAGQGSDKDLNITARGGLFELAEIWLAYLALVDKRAMSGTVVVRWADLSEGDKQQTFEWVKWLHSRGGLTTKTALVLSNLIENVDYEYEAAQDEYATRIETTSFDDFTGPTGSKNGDGNLTAEGKPDGRKSGGSAPRMPAFGGGGRG